MYKQVVQPPVHFKLLAQVKPGSLPEIPKGFNARKEASANPKCHKLWKDVNTWCKEVVLFQAVEDCPVSNEHTQQLVDKDAEKKQLADCVRKAHAVRERCVHSMVHPELYTSAKTADALYVFWSIASQLTTEGEGRYNDCEFYTPGKGFSPYFSRAAVSTSENNRHSFEFYSLLTRFAIMFPFAYKDDEKAFGLWIDGYDMDIIATIVKKEKEWVKKKIEYYVEIAKANAGKFLQEREDDEDDGPEEVKTVRLGGGPMNVTEMSIADLGAIWKAANASPPRMLLREDEMKNVADEIERRAHG
jgi:hypothetical protein